ncbi:MAG: HAD hydrolase family protein [Verrucomicrobia bacterium]|nr:HAD hydrolase family protein [Verrucomicrobiota bacterium]
MRLVASRIRLLLLDVDGVLTDGRLYIGDAVGADGGSSRVELKAFHIQDGHGMKMAARGGLEVGWISSRFSAVTSRRAKDLGISLLSQPAPEQKPPPEKLEVARLMVAKLGIGLEQVCFVGDDLVDVPLMKAVALPVAVANAVPEVCRLAAYVTQKPGGEGAVREVIELILKSQGLWPKLVSKYGIEER